MKKSRGFIRKINDYIINPDINLSEKAYVVFSTAVLIALFVSVPCGLIMEEPFSATISTLIGAIAFTVFVYISYKTALIHKARIILSVIVVFIFMPAMFFTNGGVSGGTPIWLLLGTIYVAFILDGKIKYIMLFFNCLISLICWLVGYYYPGTVTEYSRKGIYIDTLAALYIVGGIIFILISFQVTMLRKEEVEKTSRRLFEQTATALVNSIDAKDEYTHGHSSRVADYSKKIAEFAGKSSAECDEIYYVALLHDVGKIGIPVSIISKKGRLTDEEYEMIKQHPVLGAKILESVNEYPNLAIGAKYHHERYDGKGYPEGLKGKEIPEIARIIAVADAYDAMTSNRSYRAAIPQHIVREELVKGIGTQFDPDFARSMIRMIDMDIEYKMKESVSGAAASKSNGVHCESIYHDCTDGIGVTRKKTDIRFLSRPDNEAADGQGFPTIIVFDSLDAKVHPGEENNKDLLYFEYAQIKADGAVIERNVRKSEVRFHDAPANPQWNDASISDRGLMYKIETVRNRDHVIISVTSEKRCFDVILALPDTSRYVSLAFSGERCNIYNIKVDTDTVDTEFEAIPRIAEEISYTKNCPVGDLPNIEIDGPRFATTKGIRLDEDITVRFHAVSYPTARLVWHCPYFSIFTSSNGRVDAEDFREFLLLKMDGENWKSEEPVENNVIVKQTESFKNWNEWMDKCKQGLECKISIRREGNKITMKTENLGIALDSTTVILDGTEELYFALTGDQCAISNIRLSKN